MARIQSAVEESERRFAGNDPESDGSFLWEHTLHVAAIAFALARSEKADSPLAAVVALLHDAGKFSGGLYHEGDEPEEAAAARLAVPLLRRSKMGLAERGAVGKALGALYNPSASADPLAAIVHDADFLSKFGLVGVAQFFIKSALRGKTLGRAVAESLSKELTYAACLPANMRTAAGRVQAERKAAETTAFFEAFLSEIRETRGLKYRIETVFWAHPRRPELRLRIRLVRPEACDRCGGRPRTSLASVSGTKCERLEARIECGRCGARSEISFCLPELAA